MLMFFHQYLNIIVKKLYLSNEELQVKVHRYMANFFREKADPEGNFMWKSEYRRGFSELLYHELLGKRWNKVEGTHDQIFDSYLSLETLTDIRFIEAKCNLGMTFDLVSEYLAALEEINKPNLLGASWEGYSFFSVHAVEEFLKFVQGQGHVFEKFPFVVYQQVTAVLRNF